MPVALSSEAAPPPPRGLTRSGNASSSRSAALDRIASGLIASRAGGVGGPAARRRPRPASATFVAPAPPLPSRTGSTTVAAPNATDRPVANATTMTATTMTPPKAMTAKKEMRRTAVLCLGLVDRLRDERVSAVAPLTKDEDVGDLMVDFPSETERMALRRERSLGSSLDLSGLADCHSDDADEDDQAVELPAEELERGVSSSSSSSVSSSRRSSLSSSASSFSAAAAHKPILRRHRKYSQSVPAPPSYGFSDVSTNPNQLGGAAAAHHHRAARRRSSITSAFARRSSTTSSSLASSCGGGSRRTSTCSTLTASTLSADSNRSLLSNFFDDSQSALHQSASGSTRMRIRIVDRDSEEGWRSGKSVRFAEDEEEEEEEASCGNSWHGGSQRSLELSGSGGRTETLTLDSGARSA